MAKLELYKVTVNYCLYVVASDPWDAEGAMQQAVYAGYVEPSDATITTVVDLNTSPVFAEEDDIADVCLGDVSDKIRDIFANHVPSAAFEKLKTALANNTPYDDEDDDEDDDEEEEDEETRKKVEMPAPEHLEYVRVSGYQGVAFIYLGPGRRAIVEDDGVVVEEPDYAIARVSMVGDDRVLQVSRCDLVALDDNEFCMDCGQIGCGHGRC